MKKHLQLILSLLCVLALVFGITAALAEDDEVRVITIKWEDENNYNGYRPTTEETIIATLGGQKAELKAENDWTGSVTVPAGTDNEWAITPPAHYYRAGFDRGPVTVVTFKNAVAPATSYQAQIVWDDNHNEKGVRPPAGELVLYADGQLYGEPQEKAASVTWTDLPAYAPASDTPIKYTVGVLKDPEGYTSTVDGNTVTFALNTVDVAIKAAVSGYPAGTDLSGLRLYVDGPDPTMPKTLKYADVAGGSYTLAGVLPGAYLVRDLNADSLVAEYNAAQKEVEGGKYYVMDKENSKVCDAVYVASGTASLEWKYAFKEATKYEDDPNYDAEEFKDYDPWKNVGDLKFTILGPDEKQMPMTLTLANFTKIDDNTYRSNEIENLKPGVYTVVETNAEGLVKYYTLKSDSKTALKIEVTANGSSTAKLENYYAPAPTPEPDAEYVDVPVTKTWNDNANKDGNRPASITVRLYADGVEADSHVLTAAENWAYTFANLPRYQEDKKTEIVYSVDEDAVPMYTKEIRGYNLANYYLPETTSRAVAKIWDDNNDEQKIRPKNITMFLSNQTGVVATVILSDANNWTAAVYDLPTMVNGEKAVYSWSEQLVLGYSDEPVVREQDGTMTFINRPWERPDQPAKGGKAKTRGNEYITLDDYDTPLGVDVIINHVGDCFD